VSVLKFSKFHITILLSVTLIGVLIAVSFHIPLVLGFLPGFISLVFLSRSKGLSNKQILLICKMGVKRTSGVIWILLLVGFLLPSWYLAGTIEQMVSIAVHVITPEHFFTLSFIISLIFSMILGTSVGTLSAIGIPIMGTALALNLPLEIVAGSLISGAFVGDRTSPFSSAHQLLAHTLELSIKKQFRSMALTSTVAIICGLFFYSILDYLFLSGFSKQDINDMDEFSILKFIPPTILIVLVFLRYKILYAFIISIASACTLSILNGVEFIELFRSLWFGINGLGGGFVNMYLLLSFLGLAGAYNGLLEELKVVQSILDQWLESSHSLLNDTFKTMLATLGITLIAANQTLPIILTGRSFLPHWSSRYSNGELSRVMGDSTMLFPGIVPWSVLTIMCSTILGVSIVNYFVYAIILWILPILTICVSKYKNKKVKRLVPVHN
jgi:Na+:H+ antiporter, NhaC family